MDLREIPSTAFERHPWEVARAEFLVRAVRERVLRGPVTVLDVGGGDGYVGRRLLEALPPGSEVTCLDPNYTDEQMETLGTDGCVGLRFTRAPVGDAADWLLMLDVLEHVDDDVALLRGFARDWLRPGGHALLSVPAWPSLFTQHDIVLGHRRRYVPGQLRRVTESAGLEPLVSGSLFSSLLVPRATSKLAERLRGVASTPTFTSPSVQANTAIGAWRGAPALTAVLTWGLRQDLRATGALARAGIKVPGLSVWCLAQKAPVAA